MAEAGFTVFTINHRASPKFRYPAAVEDAQRAVRWVRANAETYGIAPDRLAAVGGSSGGHLSLMLGLMDGEGDAEHADIVQRQSSRVQCVVALAPATHLSADDFASAPATVIGSFIGKPSWPSPPAEYEQASPIFHAKNHQGTRFLLIHGAADSVVPVTQSTTLADRLRAAQANVKLVVQQGVEHGVPQLVDSAVGNALPSAPAIAQWLKDNL